MTLVEWTPMKGWSCSGAPYSANPHRRVKRECTRPVTSAWLPATDIYDTKDSYVFKMEVPGFSKEEISMEFKENTLIVKGEHKSETGIKTEEKAGDKAEVKADVKEDVVYQCNERPKGNFSRSFKLPKSIDGKKIEARLKNGILKLTVPKPEEQKPKNIPISFN